MTVQFDRKVSNRFLNRRVPLRKRGGIYRNGLKRVFDTSLILATLPFSLIVIFTLALCVSLDGGKPFYRSPRVGRSGKIFGMWKLRTMAVDADLLLDRYLSQDVAARQEWARSQKLKCDPRITRFGRILRKTSLDELPQLLNVIKGDMALVGPRPMLPEQQTLYPGIAYYALRPGMTGPWQVMARNDSEFCRRSDYDQAYDKELSLLTDLKLLLRTIFVVIKGTGY